MRRRPIGRHALVFDNVIRVILSYCHTVYLVYSMFILDIAVLQCSYIVPGGCGKRMIKLYSEYMLDS